MWVAGIVGLVGVVVGVVVTVVCVVVCVAVGVFGVIVLVGCSSFAFLFLPWALLFEQQFKGSF